MTVRSLGTQPIQATECKLAGVGNGGRRRLPVAEPAQRGGDDALHEGGGQVKSRHREVDQHPDQPRAEPLVEGPQPDFRGAAKRRPARVPVSITTQLGAVHRRSALTARLPRSSSRFSQPTSDGTPARPGGLISSAGPRVEAGDAGVHAGGVEVWASQPWGAPG